MVKLEDFKKSTLKVFTELQVKFFIYNKIDNLAESCHKFIEKLENYIDDWIIMVRI